jgi:hypothetical protein
MSFGQFEPSLELREAQLYHLFGLLLLLTSFWQTSILFSSLFFFSLFKQNL